MSNFELFELDPIDCEAYQTKEVLKILLHSIIFQRALAACRLCDAESDLFDVSYVRCDSRAICQRVEEYAEAFSTALERSAAAPLAAAPATGATGAALPTAGAALPSGVPPSLPARIALSFIERRSRPSTFGIFGRFAGEEKVTWERWHIVLMVKPPEPPSSELASVGGSTFGSLAPAGGAEAARTRQQQQQALGEELRGRLEMILTTAASRKEHIPPVDGLGGDSTSWFEVTSDSESWGGLGDLFKQWSGRGSLKPF